MKPKSKVWSKARQRAYLKAVTPRPNPYPMKQLIRLDTAVAKAFLALHKAIPESYGVMP